MKYGLIPVTKASSHFCFLSADISVLDFNFVLFKDGLLPEEVICCWTKGSGCCGVSLIVDGGVIARG